MIRMTGTILLICGFCLAIGYLLYTVIESTPTALIVAIIIIVLGFLLIMASLSIEGNKILKLFGIVKGSTIRARHLRHDIAESREQAINGYVRRCC